MIRLHFTGSLLAAGLFVTACGDSNSSSGPTDNFDRQALLAGVADGVIVPTYRDFVTRAEVLRDRTAEWAAVPDFASADAAAARAAAQTAWSDAMRAWQRAELMQVGPAGSGTDIIAGQAIRDEIYSWDAVSACRVDQELVENAFEGPNFFTNELVNVTGMDALEYLLFYAGDTNDCAQSVPINRNGTWDAALPAIPERRARYAAAAAADVLGNAQTLLSRWEGGFRDQFVNPDAAGSPYRSRQEAIDQLFAALFYLDLKVKDEKLAIPVGISADCAQASCPDRVESRWAEVSLAHIRENIAGASLLLLGGTAEDPSAVGFDDFLTELNAAEAAAQLRNALAGMTASATAMEGDSLRAIMASDLQSPHTLHDDVKSVTDILKSQFVTVLNLRVPREGAGDND